MNVVPTAPVTTMRSMLMLAAMLVFFMCSTFALAAEPGQLAHECFMQPDHPSIRACLTEEAKASTRRLEASERAALDRIRHGDVNEEYRGQLAQSASKTMQSYRVFRDDQCAFAWVTAQGGNSAEDKRLACQALLDDMQSATWNSYVTELGQP